MTTKINASTSGGLVQTADTSGVLELQSNGVTEFTVDSTGAYGTLQRATAQNSTSGTAIDFTGIPAWVKRITVMFNGVSLSGTSNILVQIGSGSITNTGYFSNYSQVSGGGYATGTSAAGFIIGVAAAAGVCSGILTISNITANTFVSSACVTYSTSASSFCAGNSPNLSGTLDRIRITTVNGTDTFDAGSINIIYEG